jgi:hypothetical protein
MVYSWESKKPEFISEKNGCKMGQFGSPEITATYNGVWQDC